MVQSQGPKRNAAVFQHFRVEFEKKKELDKRRQEEWVADGEQGESYAEAWLVSREIEHLRVDQSARQFNEELQTRGGKRPDFIAKWIHGGQEIVLLFDAKHRDISDDRAFCITDAEIKKYCVTEKWMTENNADATRVLVIFIVIPKSSQGRDIYIVGLDEVLKEGAPCSIAGKSGKKIHLHGRQAEW
ncbi:hypothetical protein AQB9606_00311 [Aquabacterium sp. CECT 9606]|nr:hypothetical protein AQB9606_00311 [Aquabacterium sp. CECT 9606]